MPKKPANWGSVLGTSRQRGVGIVAPAEPPPGQEGTPNEKSVHLPIARIIPDPAQPRNWDAPGYAEDFEGLKHSLAQRGQLQAISVRYDPQQDIYIIILGEGRWRAARELGWPRIWAEVEYGDLRRDEILLRQLEENTQRSDLAHGERLATLAALLEEHDRAWIQENSSYWRNESTLSRWVAVAENHYLPNPEDPEQQIDTWEWADTHGITAAYNLVAERRRAEREEAGRLPMGRPTLPPPAGPERVGAGSTRPAADSAETEEEWEPEEDGERAAGPSAPAARPASPGRAGARGTMPPAPRPQRALAPADELGVISVDGTLYTIQTARDLAAGVYDVPELDRMRQLVGHAEFGRWFDHGTREDQATLVTDYRGVVQFLRETAQLIEDAVGPDTDE